MPVDAACVTDWLNGVVALAAHLNASGDTAKSSLVVDLQVEPHPQTGSKSIGSQ